MRISDWSSDVCSSDLRGRLAVLADVGAVEGEVAGVARPHPVVDVAAERADAARRRVDQAHVADLQVPEQAVGVAAGETVKAAAVAAAFFAAGDQLRSEEHTSELQSLMRLSYAALVLNKKNT